MGGLVEIGGMGLKGQGRWSPTSHEEGFDQGDGISEEVSIVTADMLTLDDQKTVDRALELGVADGGNIEGW